MRFQLAGSRRGIVELRACGDLGAPVRSRPARREGWNESERGGQRPPPIGDRDDIARADRRDRGGHVLLELADPSGRHELHRSTYPCASSAAALAELGESCLSPAPHYSAASATAGRCARPGAGPNATRFTSNSAAGINNASASNGSTAFAPMPRLSATTFQANAADEDPEWDADDEADERERRRLPRHRCLHLPTAEAQRLQHRELAAAPAHGGDQRIADGDQRERGREARRASGATS